MLRRALPGLACWTHGIPLLIGNLSTPKYGIKTAEVGNGIKLSTIVVLNWK